jgi:glycosyltransferase involved in cell wall biosynthesis
MKRICIILPKLTAGGTERTAVELADFLVNQNVEVTILLMYQQPVFFSIDSRVKVIEPNLIYRKYLGRVLYVPYVLWFLRKHIVKFKPDTVFLLGYILFGLFATIRIKTRVVVSWRSSPDRIRFPGNYIGNKLYKYFHLMLSKRVDGIIAQTMLAKKIYKDSYNCQINVIPNFLKDINYYPENQKDNIVINVGRLVNEKGQKYLLQAFARLNYVDWKLWLVGDGPLRNKLEKLAEDLGVSDRVVFWGYQKDVDFYLSKASIFAFSSIVEGYPNALIEAMAHGLAPVSHNCNAGPSDIINHGVNGFLVETGNVDEFARYLQILIENEDLRSKMQYEAIKIKDQNNKGVICRKYFDFLFQSNTVH